MKLIGILLIIIVSFIGLAILVHICAKNNYIIQYDSNKRKIKICPAKGTNFTKQTDRDS